MTSSNQYHCFNTSRYRPAWFEDSRVYIEHGSTRLIRTDTTLDVKECVMTKGWDLKDLYLQIHWLKFRGWSSDTTNTSPSELQHNQSCRVTWTVYAVHGPAQRKAAINLSIWALFESTFTVKSPGEKTSLWPTPWITAAPSISLGAVQLTHGPANTIRSG